ncbi:MAG: dipeptide epimerase [Chloroflexota bacterium]|nr:dipeptide epimerase [Chloroflexota bacterium]
MRIERIEVTPLNLTPQVALTVAYGSYPVLEYALLKLYTDAGHVGLGEAAPDPEVTGETQESVIQALRTLAPLLEGRDPFDIEAILRAADEAVPGYPAALAAVDMALYDLMGKALGVPVYKLLGGKVRDGMRLYPVIPMNDPQTMAAMAAQFAGMGYEVLKPKLGSDPETDEARLAAISEAVGPGARLRPDVNQGWGDADTAIGAIERLRRFNIEWVEQPVAARDLAGLAAVKAAVDVPIMADESCHTPADALAIARQEAADIINIKLMKCGGIYRAMQILAIAEAAGLPCIVGSMGESSIGSAAGMHLVAAKAGIVACELIGPLFLQGDPATGYDADVGAGWARVSEKPGLGVKLR